MLNSILTSLFGSRNKRLIKRLFHQVTLINDKESLYSKLSDTQLRAKTVEFRALLQQGRTLDALLPDAFAVVREAAKRTLGMRHFDVQLLGGIVLHSGNIAEMRTGEGKTLVSTLAAYLNALPQKGVHIVTVNDYLAKRDSSWMKPIYEFLALTVGVITPNMPAEHKITAYAADITYGTNNEFGFDYLRDNMVFQMADKVQRGSHYAIIDEVDSILVDEARTPLIISGPADENIDCYRIIDELVNGLQLQTKPDAAGDYYVEAKSKQVHLTESGHQKIEELFIQNHLLASGDNLYDANNIILIHHLNAALRAHNLFHRDVDYIVKNGEVVIVDEHTGRAMPGRRWSEGLHQAVEAKEKVNIQQENQTLASITFQNYFRSYEKLSGMTGTADTEAYELQQIYGLEVVVIPPNKPMIRQDLPDCVFINSAEKFKAVVAEIKTTYQSKQPILVGTTSIESSELISRLLTQAQIPHQVLNAKYHEQEAAIIAEAGREGAVTIATNMAGRGTDIVLGGNLDAELKAIENISEADAQQRELAWRVRHDKVVSLGGLYVLGTERHESRRIDNQLRGRAGRQGDPGKSRFYLSLEDNLLRIFGGEKLLLLMQKMGVEQNAVIESRLLSRGIENAQRKVEAYNFDIRKQLLEYDDVANEQRKVIFSQRDELLLADNSSEVVYSMCDNVAYELIEQFWPQNHLIDHVDTASLAQEVLTNFNLQLNLTDALAAMGTPTPELLRNFLKLALRQQCAQQIAQLDGQNLEAIIKEVIIQILDKAWREHLVALDYLRQGIHLRSYAQKNPKQEYKIESFALFTNMLHKITHEVVTIFSNDVLEYEVFTLNQKSLPNSSYQYLKFGSSDAPLTSHAVPNVKSIGRNQACHCGSKKKYKHCHGVIQ